MLRKVPTVKVISKTQILKSKNPARISYLHFNQQQTNRVGQRAAECILRSPGRTSRRLPVSLISGQTAVVHLLLLARVSYMLSLPHHLCPFSLVHWEPAHTSRSCSLLSCIRHCWSPLPLPLRFITVRLLASRFSMPTAGDGSCAQPKDVTRQLTSKGNPFMMHM